MASRPDGWMVEVELVEDDGTSAPSPDSAAPGDTPRGAPRGVAALTVGTGDTADAPNGAPRPVPSGAELQRGRAVAVRWAAAGAVLAATAGALVLLDPGEPSTRTELGVLATRWTERWSAPADRVLAVRDGIVTVTSLASSEPMLRGLDQATGEQVWSVLLDGSGPADTCAVGVTLDPPTAWCWREPHLVVDADGDGASIGEPALVGIDLSDGTVTSERELAEPSAGYGVVGQDLVLGERLGGVLVVRRVEPSPWREVWRTELDLAPRVSDGMHAARLEVADGFVIVHGPTTAVLAAADGTVLGTWTPVVDAAGTGFDGAEVATTAAGFATWSTVADGERLPAGTWHDSAGRVVAELEGRLAEPPGSDGSVPEVLLLAQDAGQTLVALDLGAGTELWRTPLRGGRVVARYDGVVVVAADGRLRSLEVLTGIERWSVETSGLRAALGGISDGHAVVVTSVRDNRWVVDAVRLADGEQLWTMQIPGSREIGFIAFPPGLQLADGYPVVWRGRTVIWTGR